MHSLAGNAPVAVVLAAEAHTAVVANIAAADGHIAVERIAARRSHIHYNYRRLVHLCIGIIGVGIPILFLCVFAKKPTVNSP